MTWPRYKIGQAIIIDAVNIGPDIWIEDLLKGPFGIVRVHKVPQCADVEEACWCVEYSDRCAPTPRTKQLVFSKDHAFPHRPPRNSFVLNGFDAPPCEFASYPSPDFSRAHLINLPRRRSDPQLHSLHPLQ